MTACLLFFCVWFNGAQFPTAIVQSDNDLDQIVMDAFRIAHDGYSSDEVILNSSLNRRFLDECKKRTTDLDEFQCNWKLMNLRKAGKLKSIETTRRGPRPDRNVFQVAEIASRTMMDRHRVSIDKIMADPVKRQEFDGRVQQFNDQLDLYAVRKAAFQLRKARRLRPELITRIADWDRRIDNLSITEIEKQPDLVPSGPGIYIFHDQSGYLYVGQSENLRRRLEQHLEDADNKALLNYLVQGNSREIFIELHSFPADSRAKELIVRRAYESELIRSRKPKFNILP